MAKKPNKDILEHERKRQIEVKVVMWADAQKFEERGFTEEEIEKRKAEKRAELMKHLEDEELQIKATESHRLSAAKEAENSKLKNALGLEGYEGM